MTEPRIFIGTMAIGYDYMLFTSMLGVFCIAIAFTLFYRKIKRSSTKQCPPRRNVPCVNALLHQLDSSYFSDY